MGKSDAPTDAVLSVENLTFEFASQSVLAVPSATLNSGNSLAVTGQNGAGKTTFLRIVSGAVKPTDGEIKVFSLNPDERSTKFRKLIATQLSLPPMAEDLTVIEHLMLVGTSWGLTSGHAIERSNEMLSQFGIAYIAKHYPHELSSGERQIFSLSMVLTRPSKLLILDEPERHLDTERISILANVLKSYMHDGGAVLVATHSLQLTTQLGCPVLELHRPAAPPTSAVTLTSPK